MQTAFIKLCERRKLLKNIIEKKQKKEGEEEEEKGASNSWFVEGMLNTDSKVTNINYELMKSLKQTVAIHDYTSWS